MHVQSFCLAGDDPLRLQKTLLALADHARNQLPQLQRVLVFRVLRNIPTDSVTADQALREILPRTDEIKAIVECSFVDEASRSEARASDAWSDWCDSLRNEGEVLYAFDSFENVPIKPIAGALNGGFRRWMPLKRAAASPDTFRDGWFGRHADLVQHLPHVQGYIQQLVDSRFEGDGSPSWYERLPVDGIAQLCFANEEKMRAAYSSDARLPLRDDGRTLLAGIATLLVHGACLLP